MWLAPAHRCQPSLMRSHLSGLYWSSFVCRQKQHPNLFPLIATMSLHLQSAFHPDRSYRSRTGAEPWNQAFCQLQGGGWGEHSSYLGHVLCCRFFNKWKGIKKRGEKRLRILNWALAAFLEDLTLPTEGESHFHGHRSSEQQQGMLLRMWGLSLLCSRGLPPRVRTRQWKTVAKGTQISSGSKTCSPADQLLMWWCR